MKQNKSIILGIVILLVALAGAVVLTGGSQNLQKGAAFDTSTLRVLPSSKITAAVGDNFSAEVWYYTSGNSKVDGVQTEVCYGNGITLKGVTVNTAAGFNSDPITVTRALSTGSCTMVVVTSMQAATNLSTTGKAFTLNFTGVTAGTGNISLDSSTSQMTGDNPASATDKNITVTGVTGTSYEITGGRQDMCKSASISAANPATTDNVTMSSSVKDGMTADHFTYAVYNLDNLYGPNNPKPVCVATGEDSTNVGDCPAGTHHLVFMDPNTAVRQSGTRAVPYSELFVKDANNGNKPLIHAQILAYFQLGSGAVSLPEPNCVVFTNATSIPVSTALLLRFNITYAGIAANAQCADPQDMPMTVMVRTANGTSKSYENVIATKLGGGVDIGVGGILGIYQVNLRLEGFTSTDNLAVFVVDKKHVQVKYAVNGQKDFYNKAGGELSKLTNDEASTPIFDFTRYPLLAGDVVDDNGTVGVQNGKIDGLDFSYVKSMAIGRTAVDPGGYMLADLNGDCKMEDYDRTVLMVSLKERQAQLY